MYIRLGRKTNKQTQFVCCCSDNACVIWLPPFHFRGRIKRGREIPGVVVSITTEGIKWLRIHPPKINEVCDLHVTCLGDSGKALLVRNHTLLVLFEVSDGFSSQNVKYLVTFWFIWNSTCCIFNVFKSWQQIVSFNPIFIIDIMELKQMMEKLGQAKTHLELKKMIAEIDTDDSGTINYTEFLHMMLGKKNSILKM